VSKHGHRVSALRAFTIHFISVNFNNDTDKQYTNLQSQLFCITCSSQIIWQWV